MIRARQEGRSEEDLIAQVRALDMDEVRATMAAEAAEIASSAPQSS